MYLKKDTKTYILEYDRVLNELKKLDTLQNPSMPKIHERTIEGNYKVTGDTKVIPVSVEHEEEEIQRAGNNLICTEAG